MARRTRQSEGAAAQTTEDLLPWPHTGGREAKLRRWCMIGNLAPEMSASSPPIREKLAAVFAAWSRGIETCVREAQADGSMRRDLNARESPSGTSATAGEIRDS